MTKVAVISPLKRKANSKGNHKRIPKRRANAKGKAKGRSAGTITTTKGKGSKNDPTVTGEQTFYSKADGATMKKSLNNVYKILSASTAHNWYQTYAATALWGSASPWGYNQMTNNQSAAGSTLTLPLYIHDLNSVPNVVNGTITTPSASFVMQAANETAGAAITFKPTGYGTNGSQELFLQNTVGASNNADSYPGAEDMHISTQIKLNLVGALSIPITFHVYIVSFKKDYLCPDVMNTLTQTTTTTAASYYAEAVAFWESLIKPMLYNPILVQSSPHLKDMKVHKHDAFHLEPKLSTEPQSNEGAAATWPHVKTVSYFERYNTKCDYKWDDNASVPLTGTGDVQRDVGDVRCTVAPQKRKYLIVMAESFETNQSQTFNTVRNASYDFMIKHKHSRVL